MNLQQRNWLVVTLLVALFGGLWINATRVAAEDVNPTGRPPSPDIGHPAPDFELTTPNGETLRLSSLEGQVVVLNFWATWCPPCRAEIPALQGIYESSDNVVVVGVNAQESRAEVQSFMQSLDADYPVVLDTNGAVNRTYLVRALPTTYFIDERGVIVDVFGGPLSQPLLERKVSEIVE